MQRSEGQKIGGVDSKLKSKWPFMDRLDADAKAPPGPNTPKILCSKNAAELFTRPVPTAPTTPMTPTTPTAPTAPHITHSALLFFLFLNRVLLFDRDRPMQSFYRGVVGKLIKRWRHKPFLFTLWLARSNYIGHLTGCLLFARLSIFTGP